MNQSKGKQNMFRRIVFGVPVFILLLCPALRADAPGNKDADIIYMVTINNPADGRINVEAVFNKLPGSNLVIAEQEVFENLHLSGLNAKDEQGLFLPISYTVKKGLGFGRFSEKKVYTIESANAKVVTVGYSVRPGAIGRHGHTGYLDERFGLVAGKSVFLFPPKESGINKIAVEFKLPQGWEAVCPWKKDGDIFVIKRGNYRFRLNMSELLGEAVIGFGSFKVCQREVNGFNISVYTYAGWTDKQAGSICEQAFKLAKYQMDLFDVNEKWDYTVIFVPSAADKERVFGGCWALGQGFEMGVLTPRRWELFSHRVHHAFNKYSPFGMYMDKKSSGWFIEATASYYEIKSLASMGYYKQEDRLSRMLSAYEEKRPAYDIPLSQDYKKLFETLEYLHYLKAPLVGYLIDEKIKKDTNGTKDLDKFMKYIYFKHGMKKSAVRPKAELEEFTGSDFTAFFDKYVDGTELIELHFGTKKYIAIAVSVVILAGVWVLWKSRRRIKYRLFSSQRTSDFKTHRRRL
ncbi:MAG: hypothetical protein LHV69_11690 [Elusimicrobia bacterium]|nr:hypothetical protein [Candidatus Obscuribacterium magneticum]